MHILDQIMLHLSIMIPILLLLLYCVISIIQLILLLSTFFRKEDPCFFNIESTLRAFLLKIGVCDAMLQPNPSGKDCMKHINVMTKENNSNSFT